MVFFGPFEITVPPAAALEAIYAVLALCYTLKVALSPGLKFALFQLLVYICVRLAAFALRLALVSGSSVSVDTFTAAQILFSAGYFIIVSAGSSFLAQWYIALEDAFPSDAAGMGQQSITQRTAVARRFVRIAQIVGVVSGIVGGVGSATQLTSATPDQNAINRAKNERYVSAAIFLGITVVFIPGLIIYGLQQIAHSPLSSGASTPLPDTAGGMSPSGGTPGGASAAAARSQTRYRLYAGAGVLLALCGAMALRAALVLVQATSSGESEAELYGYTIAPELFVVLLLLPPAVERLYYRQGAGAWKDGGGGAASYGSVLSSAPPRHSPQQALVV